MSRDFSVVAIVAAYNEADIVGQVVRDLLNQNIQVYFLDDGSTDDTVRRVEPFVGRGVLAIERRPDAPRSSDDFEWERILRRKTALASELSADWFIHHDADEFRESPWADLTLKEAVRRVDSLGYNAIDFESLDFWPTHDRFRAGDDVRSSFPFYSRRAPYDRVQIRCWKKTPCLDLASSGGHDAEFPERHVFPLRFILRHYPIRGQAHGERKIFRERRNRFIEAERARGWHVQYDGVKTDESFIRDSASLIVYDPDVVRFELLLRHRGLEEVEDVSEARRADLEATRRDLDTSRQDADRLKEDASRLREAVAGQADDIARLQGELSVRHAAIRDLEHRLQDRTAQHEDSRAQLRRQSLDIESWRASVDHLLARIDALERSFSWRWTAPVRALVRLLLGR